VVTLVDDRKRITGTKGREMLGKKIALCITGSVAAMESPRIARDLMRHGAEVVAVLSESASRIVSPDLMEWATGNDVVKEITSKIEHVQLGGRGEDAADLVLIAPCTANTISKIANGISDTPVTALVSCAIGSRIPIVIAPGMHEPMYDSPLIKRNVQSLRSTGIEFVEPILEEGKAKIVPPESIVKHVINALSEKSLKGKKFIITAGPTVEHIDPVRVLTNRSSGKMGIALAEVAFNRGADVTLVYGPGYEPPPAGVKVVRVETTDDMFAAVKNEMKSKPDVVIAAAAPADFSAEKPYQTKLDSKEKLEIKLKPTPKIIDVVKKLSNKTKLVAFKVEFGKKEIKKVSELFERSKADLVVVNDVSKKGVGFGTDTNEVAIYDKSLKSKKLGLASKREIAEGIIDRIQGLIR
jgi:phosphopantothenoylcysteine decarboxylase/phosphopantothenate--cysteine ligase